MFHPKYFLIIGTRVVYIQPVGVLPERDDSVREVTLMHESVLMELGSNRVVGE